jgi:GNAT superfamily N-acetyltransferase
VIFRKLSRQHDREAFDCGVESVNRYLRQTARQQADKGLALTFVLLETADGREIIGYHTLVMSTVSCAIVPGKGLPRHQSAPVVLLAQFGVDQRHQGRGHGKRLLYHALYQAMNAAEHVGCLAVVLDAVDEPAREFYLARGFQELADDPHHLWLPMSAIRDMFAAEAP